MLVQRRFLNAVTVFSLLCSLGKWSGPPFEQTWISIIQGCIVQSMVKFGPVVLEMKMFIDKCCQCMFAFYYYPLEKGDLNKLKFHSLKDALHQAWWKLALVVLERRWKCEKTYRQTDKLTTDNQWSESFQLKRGKNNHENVSTISNNKKLQHQSYLSMMKKVTCSSLAK